MTRNLKRGPLISAGVLIGAGMGGFLDGIILHQILQLHNMLSSRIPPSDLVSVKINMTWDGYFHAGVWLLTAVGLYLLFRAGQRRDVLWSGRVFLGSWIAGWGLFNLVEGIIDHQILGIHHVHEYSANKLFFDFAFLLFGGVLLIVIGGMLIRSSRNDAATRGDSE